MKNSPTLRVFFVVLGCFHLLAGAAWSQVMVSPVSVLTTNIATYNDTVSVTNMVNQSGVTTPFVSGTTVFDTYFANPGQTFATSGNGGTNNWQSEVAFDSGYQGFVDFDLGGVFEINKLAIWNRSVSNVTVKILRDLGGPEQVVGDFTLINRQSFSFSYAVDLLAFNASYQGRYVRLVVNSIYPIQGFTFGYVNLGEVVASATPVGAPLPTLNIVKAPNGDVTITFSGTLQTASRIDGAFTNAPGAGSSPHIVSKASLSSEQYFRAQGN